MRKGYWIIAVFAIWCLVSALWYMFSVKGLPDNTGLIKPATTTMAIVEIIVMITVAFLMGFGLAWMMRSQPLEDAIDELRNTKTEFRELEQTITVHKETVITREHQARAAEETAASALASMDQLKLKVSDLTLLEQDIRSKNQDLQTKVKILDDELTSAKFRIRVLEGEISDKDKALEMIKEQVEEAGVPPKPEHREWSDHPFVRPITIEEINDKDDLTEIKGIGPAFQKKLNALDLYTFKQLSELDGEAVERLAEIIEVFPERIHRDNWIGQATKLYLKKIGQEL